VYFTTKRSDAKETRQTWRIKRQSDESYILSLEENGSGHIIGAVHQTNPDDIQDAWEVFHQTVGTDCIIDRVTISVRRNP
jgi:hypothetical protein